jgi:ABC-type nitrate/sulfonate/bicarbonate transport system substrate-binding protein
MPSKEGVITCAALVLLTTVAAFGVALPAQAGDKVAVGKGQAFVFSFTAIDLGAEKGLFKKFGFDEVKPIAFTGDGKVQQAMIAGEIQFAITGGGGLAFPAKGAASKTVAAIQGAPYNMWIAVPVNSPIKTVADLKGKKLAVSSTGSLTDWLAKRLPIIQGWNETDVTAVPMGGLDPRLAAMKTGQIDGMVMAAEVVFGLEEKGVTRPLYNFGQALPHFITAAAFAHRELIEKNPDMVQRFVNGLFATMQWMREHRAETIAFMTERLRSTPTVIAKTYDEQMPSFSKDGTFDPQAVEFMAQSFVEMGLIDKKPTAEAMIDARFVPAKY